MIPCYPAARARLTDDHPGSRPSSLFMHVPPSIQPSCFVLVLMALGHLPYPTVSPLFTYSSVVILAPCTIARHTRYHPPPSTLHPPHFSFWFLASKERRSRLSVPLCLYIYTTTTRPLSDQIGFLATLLSFEGFFFFSSCFLFLSMYTRHFGRFLILVDRCSLGAPF